MSHAVSHAAPRAGGPRLGTLGIPMGKLGMWVFLASEVMFFAGLIDSYIILRFSNPAWPQPAERPLWLVSLMTFVLICSSGTMVLALAGGQERNRARLLGFLAATIGGGLFFLGCQAYEYTHFFREGHFPSTNIFWSCFFTMTGFHGFHVFCGVVALVAIFFRALLGRYDGGDVLEVELVGLYWHFVDLVWIILFTILYLV